MSTTAAMNIKSLLPLALLALGSVPGTVADDGYASSCRELSFAWNDRVNSYYIMANCQEISGIFNIDTIIFLDNCFSNNWGHVIPQPKYAFLFPVSRLHLLTLTAFRGFFSGTCRGMWLDGTWMHGECNNGNGGWQSTYIDTSEQIRLCWAFSKSLTDVLADRHIGNFNGNMKCHGIGGLP